MFAANKLLNIRVLAADELSDVEGDDESKRVKPKIRRSENQNWLSLKNCLSQENRKNCHKIEIHLILAIQKLDQVF